MTLEVTKEQMALDINDFLTGRIESMTCSGEYSFDSSKNFYLFRNWVNKEGEVVDLVVPGTVYLQGYHRHGTTKIPDWFLEQEAKNNPTLIERVWRRIKGI